MSKRWVLTIGLVLIAGYQNCSNQMGFSQDSTLAGKTESAFDGGNVVDGEVEEELPPIIDDGGVVYTPPHEHAEDDDCDRDRDGRHLGSSKPDSVCVLRGPGRSITLGLIRGQLVAQNSTPDSLCMSERACRDIVGRVVPIKGPQRRGACVNQAAGTISITDAQLRGLLQNQRGIAWLNE